MRSIGLLGGMSWESTAVYYRHLNERVRSLRGGLASADIVLRSLDFQEIVSLQKADAWQDAADRLATAARGLEAAGADMVLICTNTMHKLAEEVASAVNVPLIHIADVTAGAIVAAGCRRPLLLATRYTMEQDFYHSRVRSGYDVEIMVPDEQDRGTVHDIIFGELCCGIIREESRAAYRAIMEKGRKAGADSVILGCTEIGLLVGADDTSLPVFDSTLLHADAALDYALQPAGEPVTVQ
ncbi:aspartate/glutamate racemase family protein [Nitratireductor sp. StC3]|uniref:aspartate/glutamate racemase family protein n=1 Tax=Nitratireductor sp. StC3 TaxID=2126741 RepID=UPI000D0DB502|nr:aspartate/glutamate racemase family protein [Nitratireductor sp. StC3]PSM16248.1 aspartate racemase [Nitratireductor sp. StC3]